MASSFIDPDPSSLVFLQTPLQIYLQQHGFSWVIDLRLFLRSLDYSRFLIKYSTEGRPSYFPASLLGIVFYGILKGNTSLRSLEKMAKIDLCCMWLTGGIQPDHSVIGKFLKNHQEELSQSFFEQLTRKIIQEIKIDGTRISGDGTVIQAVASRYKTLMEESLTDKLNSLEDKIKQETDSKKLERLLKKKKK